MRTAARAKDSSIKKFAPANHLPFKYKRRVNSNSGDSLGHNSTISVYSVGFPYKFPIPYPSPSFLSLLAGAYELRLSNSIIYLLLCNQSKLRNLESNLSSFCGWVGNFLCWHCLHSCRNLEGPLGHGLLCPQALYPQAGWTRLCGSSSLPSLKQKKTGLVKGSVTWFVSWLVEFTFSYFREEGREGSGRWGEEYKERWRERESERAREQNVGNCAG